jgi:glycerophosphoryl diester phosphodiesterase
MATAYAANMTAFPSHALSRLPAAPLALMLLCASVRAEAQPAVEIIGHRGAAGLAPENTLPSFSRACAVGVAGIELDVHLSADGVVVVHHDYALHPDIARDPRGAWVPDSARPLLRDRTLAELRSYDVGRLRPDTDYARRYPSQVPSDGARIPTLDDVITLFLAECAPPTRLVVEIKTDPTRPALSAVPEALADSTVARLRARGVVPRTQIIAFDWRPLRRVQAIAPEIPTSYLTVESRDFDSIERGLAGASPWMAGIDVDAHGGSVPRAIRAAGGRYWSPNFRNVTAESLAEAHAVGVRVFPWTVNAEEDMRGLIKLGVNGITTDRPDVLRRVRAGEGR